MPWPFPGRLDAFLFPATAMSRTLSDCLRPALTSVNRARHRLVSLCSRRFCRKPCGATILKLENAAGIVTVSKTHGSPGSDVSVQSVERSDAGGWILSGTLAPKASAQTVACIRDDVTDGTSAAAGSSRTWRRGHRDTPGLPLAMSGFHLPAPGIFDHIRSVAHPLARRTSRVGQI